MFTPYITPTILWELDLLVYGPWIMIIIGITLFIWSLR